MDILEAILAQTEPSFRSPEEALVYRYALELNQTKSVSDTTYAQTLERFGERTVVEVKTAFGGSGREVRALREALADIGAARGWIVDQGSGIERLDAAIARAGFAEVAGGTPA